MKQAQLRSLGRTTRRNHRQLFNYIWNNKPLKKYDFIFHAEDFVSLDNQSEKDRFFEGWIESYLDSRHDSYIGTRIKVGIPPNYFLEPKILGISNGLMAFWVCLCRCCCLLTFWSEVPEDRKRAWKDGWWECRHVLKSSSFYPCQSPWCILHSR